MQIDWVSLAADAFANATGKAAEKGEIALNRPCSHSESGNRGEAVGTNENMQAVDFNELDSACSHFPTVPTDFEEGEGAESNEYVFDMIEKPDGEGPQGGFAPERKDPAPACASCANLATPGLSSGYCGAGRADLAPAYGEGHPLRALPADGGKSCPAWTWDGMPPRGAALTAYRGPASFARVFRGRW